MVNYNSTGRPRQYKERTTSTVPLPREARDKLEQMRGDVPIGKYICRIICEYIGISEESYNLDSTNKKGVKVNATRND